MKVLFTAGASIMRTSLIVSFILCLSIRATSAEPVLKVVMLSGSEEYNSDASLARL